MSPLLLPPIRLRHLLCTVVKCIWKWMRGVRCSVQGLLWFCRSLRGAASLIEGFELEQVRTCTMRSTEGTTRKAGQSLSEGRKLLINHTMTNAARPQPTKTQPKHIIEG